MKIHFSPPFIDKNVIDEVSNSLTSGWITTGPKVKELEENFNLMYGFEASVGVNSWTSGAIMVLRWLGIRSGDEVIIPAYTYAATALAVLHAGGVPVMVDTDDDYMISLEGVKKAITEKTKAIIAVDIGGLPANYKGLKNIIESIDVVTVFNAENEIQHQLGRPLLIADAAHSFGATYQNIFADITIFSLHAVKNLTSAEGGVVSLSLPKPFNNRDLYPMFRRLTLNGQSKDALNKAKAGGWKYDILELGMKCNLPDVNAAIALGQLKSWNVIQERRKEIFFRYRNYFMKFRWAQIPASSNSCGDISSYHLFMLKIKGISEKTRDKIIDEISESGIAVNVHFIPLPLFTLFKNMGYRIENYKNTYDNYAREISLPIYPDLTDEQLDSVCNKVSSAIQMIMEN